MWSPRSWEESANWLARWSATPANPEFQKTILLKADQEEMR